jgi:hypothetical protein
MNAVSPEVSNQPEELSNYNLFGSHSALIDARARAAGACGFGAD